MRCRMSGELCTGPLPHVVSSIMETGERVVDWRLERVGEQLKLAERSVLCTNEGEKNNEARNM